MTYFDTFIYVHLFGDPRLWKKVWSCPPNSLPQYPYRRHIMPRILLSQFSFYGYSSLCLYFFFFLVFSSEVMNLLQWGNAWLVWTRVCQEFVARNPGGHPSENWWHRSVLTLRTRFVTECKHRATPSHYTRILYVHYLIY